ncbi:hypothetical protein [Serratia microhaemolytica]|uniref:hypothetical protein n=1 Tax=Serratia microhaemolytica TaxID=2675110 RepID=UPI0012D77784|nr:hypothetical protein [Serratia microhaemolytica]
MPTIEIHQLFNQQIDLKNKNNNNLIACGNQQRIIFRGCLSETTQSATAALIFYQSNR